MGLRNDMRYKDIAKKKKKAELDLSEYDDLGGLNMDTKKIKPKGK